MTALGHTSDPKALVPGDPAAVTRTADGMTAYDDELHNAGQGLRTIDTTEGWSGQAADNFRAVYHGQPSKWLTAGDAFHAAATAVTNYASTLTWAQQQAAEAIQLWNDGQAATAQARAAHDQAVQQAQQHAAAQTASGSPAVAPAIPFVDPGEAARAAACDNLYRARTQLGSAGDTAAGAVGRARDQAPPKPSIWDRIGDTLSDIGTGLLHAGEDFVNDAASLGNALLQHPGDVVETLSGFGLAAASAGGEGLGTMLDATGIGAVAGVPVQALSATGLVAGAGLMAAGMSGLAGHASGDDRVQVFNTESSGGSSGYEPTKTDRLAEHLTPKDLEGAQRELNGEVVKTKSGGDPWDHIHEVRDAQNGLVNRIQAIQRRLADTRIDDATRTALQSELSQASRLLDYSKRYLPMH
jgi:ribosomal protein S15P/S13E